ncbi:2078_t:CDS:2, partial [Paraglomus occultum]
CFGPSGFEKDESMPALVFQWNPAGFNDVAAAPGQHFTFRNDSLGLTYLFVKGDNQDGVPNVITTAINRIAEREIGTPSTAFDLEAFDEIFR